MARIESGVQNGAIEQLRAGKDLHDRIIDRLATLHKEGKVVFPDDFVDRFLNPPTNLRSPHHPSLLVDTPIGRFTFIASGRAEGSRNGKVMKFQFEPDSQYTDGQSEDMSIAFYGLTQETDVEDIFFGDHLYSQDETIYPDGADSLAILSRMEQVLQPFFALEIPQAQYADPSA